MSRMVERIHRIGDPFTCRLLPGFFLLCSVMAQQHFMFGFMQLTTLGALWIRWRDRTADPEIEETYLRAMLEANPRISQLFNVNTMHVLDFDCEFQPFPETDEFPEFENKYFRFFNTDGNMTKGHFVFGDLETNATMLLTFETMPVVGRGRFTLGEPFYYFDVKAKITHRGVLEKVVVVDRKESLKKFRPFLMMM